MRRRVSPLNDRERRGARPPSSRRKQRVNQVHAATPARRGSAASSGGRCPPGADAGIAKAACFEDPAGSTVPAQPARYLGDDHGHPRASTGVFFARATGELVPAPFSWDLVEAGAARPPSRTDPHGGDGGAAPWPGRLGAGEQSVCRNLSTLALTRGHAGPARTPASRSYAAEALEHAVPRGPLGSRRPARPGRSPCWTSSRAGRPEAPQPGSRVPTGSQYRPSGHRAACPCPTSWCPLRADQTERGQTALAGFEQVGNPTHAALGARARAPLPWAAVGRCRPPNISWPRRYHSPARAAVRSTRTAARCSTARPLPPRPASRCDDPRAPARRPDDTSNSWAPPPGPSGQRTEPARQRRDGTPARGPSTLNRAHPPEAADRHASSARGRPTARSRPSSSFFFEYQATTCAMCS